MIHSVVVHKDRIKLIFQLLSAVFEQLIFRRIVKLPQSSAVKSVCPPADILFIRPVIKDMVLCGVRNFSPVPFHHCSFFLNYLFCDFFPILPHFLLPFPFYKFVCRPTKSAVLSTYKFQQLIPAHRTMQRKTQASPQVSLLSVCDIPHVSRLYLASRQLPDKFQSSLCQ